MHEVNAALRDKFPMHCMLFSHYLFVSTLFSVSAGTQLAELLPARRLAEISKKRRTGSSRTAPRHSSPLRIEDSAAQHNCRSDACTMSICGSREQEDQCSFMSRNCSIKRCRSGQTHYSPRK